MSFVFNECQLITLDLCSYFRLDLTKGMSAFALLQTESGGVYGEEEKRFVFNNVIVGRRAKARFKISNTTKVSIYL